jgi:aminoglycoside 3-N-acetyltransferase
MAEGLTTQEIQAELEHVLGLNGQTDIIAHVNLERLGPVQGGAETVIKAILAASRTVVMPAFTYQTQIIPQDGPLDNAIAYGTGDEMNARADFYRPDLRIHPDCGIVAETLRREKDTLRSVHPILSFIAQGPDARSVLGSQTRQNPLGPIAWLEAHDGAVLLMGVDQRHNFSLHLAEQRAGRKSFTRWALTVNDIEELPNIPGCMEGFNMIWQYLYPLTNVAQIGLARCETIPIKPMLALAEQKMRENPNFMLCNKPSCLSCRAREIH